MGIFDFLKKPDPDKTLPVNNQEIWVRDTYAIWSQVNLEEFRWIGGEPYSKDIAATHRVMLRRDWGVNNYSECLSTVNEMTNFPHSANEDAAWDLCRATQLLAMAYCGGWCDRETLNLESSKVAKVIQTRFNSWDELISAYLAGYSTWANETFGGSAQDYIAARHAAYNHITTSANPAFAVDFNLEF